MDLVTGRMMVEIYRQKEMEEILLELMEKVMESLMVEIYRQKGQEQM